MKDVCVCLVSTREFLSVAPYVRVLRIDVKHRVADLSRNVFRADVLALQQQLQQAQNYIETPYILYIYILRIEGE